MPLYDYMCRRHGEFRDWREMSECGKPAPCPACGKLAQRAISAPYLGMDMGLRKAHGINEKSAHEPRVVRRRRGDPMTSHDTHHDLTQARAKAHEHHGYGHAHAPGSGKAQRSKHPWMVRH